MSAVLNRVASSTGEANVTTTTPRTFLHLYGFYANPEAPFQLAYTSIQWPLSEGNPKQDALGEFDTGLLRPVLKQDGVYQITCTAYGTMAATTTEIEMFQQDPPGVNLEEERGCPPYNTIFNPTGAPLDYQATWSGVVRMLAGEEIDIRFRSNDQLSDMTVFMTVHRVD